MSLLRQMPFPSVFTVAFIVIITAVTVAITFPANGYTASLVAYESVVAAPTVPEGVIRYDKSRYDRTGMEEIESDEMT